eukprot:1566545-Pleurochrysis_carterae.AAC.1
MQRRYRRVTNVSDGVNDLEAKLEPLVPLARPHLVRFDARGGASTPPGCRWSSALDENRIS